MDLESEGPQIIKVTPVQQMLASCTGAILTSLMVTPLDVVKIRLQAQNNPFPKGKCFVYSNGLMDHLCVCEEEGNKAWYKKPGRFQGTLDAFFKIVRNEGIKSLWSGLPPTLVMAVPATVIYFTCYDQLSALLRSKLGENESRIPIIAGIVARSMYWYNYEVLKKWLCAKSGLYEPTFMINFTSGALSGSIAAVATLPFDVVKTQKQTQLWIYESHKISMPLHMSTWAIMKNIVAKNGFAGLFTGLIPRLIKIAPACAIMISTYEFGKTFFQTQNARRQQY
ncbi:mitochondrial glutathione transporter SLC25A40 isoform X3 [Canis lupus baileyi]|uniref:solute carrier family 25 member 40 isoform X3 n=1 Tax=Canis lupus familiaris TaxID=9615 RepID=UPI0006B3C90C|nr:solute carrier family 25 member 40 isoform X3 [Canis lupus familiaris]XP_025327279.1 probable mitochondrial glutathione transporter SLC25A40 isoform X3 [Canis lupus dingo]XP_038412628.1 solute carrier family 25 member 40 isoform X3 [Canis lupus familiaris]XP_038542246.1 solute carrier family 25 member 40 isoform X3 [Canis lupus familiaris]|eukprot:XP_013974439.1 solute carrier family 25 member 40 isoform X3 [Canis lupus familiaris]